MPRYIRIDTPEGRYVVPVQFVAEARAERLVSARTIRGRQEEFRNLVWELLDDDEEAVTWMVDNLTWNQVKPYASLVDKDPRMVDRLFFRRPKSMVLQTLGNIYTRQLSFDFKLNSTKTPCVS